MHSDGAEPALDSKVAAVLAAKQDGRFARIIFGETVTIPAGGTMSNVVWGFGLPPLMAGEQINLDILSVAPGGTGTPGRDLTVTIRQ